MRRAGSLIMMAADRHRVPAGSALAVDRVGFADFTQAALDAEPLVDIRREEIANLPPESWSSVIVATGPLTSPDLAQAIRQLTGENSLSFFDAIAPIVHRDSIDFDVAWFQSRYDKSYSTGGGADYINCPMDRDQYNTFIDALVAAEKTGFKEWKTNTPYFEGCLPIEVMAERGPETLRFGPMKPVGLTNPRSVQKPYAVVQLRQDNALGTLYNMVGFQTKLTYGEQVRVFRTIPGLEKAQFARLGGIHRNTFINSPRLLDRLLRLKLRPCLRFAGQITGVEGYVESAAIGLLAGRFAAAECRGRLPDAPPDTTAFGALLNHITGGHLADVEDRRAFQPMNTNFGLFPPLAAKIRGRERKRASTERALVDLEEWLGTSRAAAE